MAFIRASGAQKAAYSLLLANGLDTVDALQAVIDDAALREAAEADVSRLTGENSRLRLAVTEAQAALTRAGLDLLEREKALAERDAELASLGNRTALLAAEVDRLTAELAARPAPPPPAPTEPPPPEPQPEPPPAEEPEEPEDPPVEPTPEPPPPQEPAPPTVQDLLLEATFTSISVLLPGAFPPAANVGHAEYRTSGTAWQVADWQGEPLPLWSVGTALLGSILECRPGTAYEVRVVTPDGVHHTGTVTTRAEDIPSRESLLAGVA